MAEYTPKFDDLDAMMDHFGYSGELGLPLRARLQTKLSPGSSGYNTLLKLSENYYSSHPGLKGRDAHRLAIDALALSDDPNRTPSALDIMVIEISTNYSKILESKTNPTDQDKDAAAKTAQDEFYDMLQKSPEEGYKKIPYLERFLDMYLAQQEDQTVVQKPRRMSSI